MKLFSDIWTGTEIISDSYKFEEVFGGVAVEVKSRLVAKGDDKVDVGCGNAFGGGEAEEEGGNAPVEKVIDLVDSFNYGEAGFDKASFVTYFKGFMKKVLEHLQANNPDRVAAFKAGAKDLFAFLKDNFDDLTIYTPSDYDQDNSLIYSYYKGEDLAPTFIYVMDALKFIKV